MSRRTEVILNLLGLMFVFLGIMTLLGFVIGLLSGPKQGFSLALVLISIAYGLMALATGVLLFRRSEVAVRAFVMWCITFIAFIASVEEMYVPLAIPGYVLGVILLVWVYRYITRHLGTPPSSSRGVSGLGRT